MWRGRGALDISESPIGFQWGSRKISRVTWQVCVWSSYYTKCPKNLWWYPGSVWLIHCAQCEFIFLVASGRYHQYLYAAADSVSVIVNRTAQLHKKKQTARWLSRQSRAACTLICCHKMCVGIMAFLSNHIYINQCEVITHPCPHVSEITRTNNPIMLAEFMSMVLIIMRRSKYL